MPRSVRHEAVLASKPAALRALASTTRQQIVDVLASTGAGTVARLGELLCRPPDALYFHLRVLERAGLVISRPSTGRGGVVYSIPGGAVRLDYELASRAGVARVVRHALALALREFERECLASRPIGRGSKRVLWAGRVMGWVSAKQLARVNALLAELHEILSRGRPGRGRRAMSLGFSLAPAGRAERVRSPARRTRATQPGRTGKKDPP